MSYYHTPSSTERSPGRLETKLSDGKLLGPPDTGWDDTLAALCGFVPVVDTVRPADTASVTYGRTLTFPGGVPTVTWVQRAKTAGELAADTASANGTSLRAAALAAIAANLTALDTVVQGHTAISTALTNAAAVKANAGATLVAVNGKVNALCDEVTRLANVLDGVLTQTDRLLRQVTAMERLQLGQLDATTGT